MPIRPENKAKYPANWKAISAWHRFFIAGNRCRFCGAENYKSHPTIGSKVILTVAHLDHDPTNCADSNLRALCQRCHNQYDARMRRAGIKERASKDQLLLMI